MEGMYPMHIKNLSRELSRTLSKIEVPESNNNETATLAVNFAAYKALHAAAERLKKASEPHIKAAFASDLSKPTEEKIELIVTKDVTVFAKIDNPRESFDKAAFIKEIANKYDISSIDLHAIAAKTVKKTAPIVKLTAEEH